MRQTSSDGRNYTYQMSKEESEALIGVLSQMPRINQERQGKVVTCYYQPTPNQSEVYALAVLYPSGKVRIDKIIAEKAAADGVIRQFVAERLEKKVETPVDSSGVVTPSVASSFPVIPTSPISPPVVHPMPPIRQIDTQLRDYWKNLSHKQRM